MSNTLPTYFISHGGGPWPWVPEMRNFFAPLEASLKEMVANFAEKPKAILMISGHWEDTEVAIMGAAKPPMIYDYSGFPPHTYDIQYSAPGAPDIAARTLDLLQGAGIKAHIDPADHIVIGRALKPLRDEGVLIVGSGLSFHNLRLPRGAGKGPSAEFDAWLFEAMNKDADVRLLDMLHWESAPAARICHQEEDHLVPLFVALGAAEDEPAERIYHHTSALTGITVSNYKFG